MGQIEKKRKFFLPKESPLKKYRRNDRGENHHFVITKAKTDAEIMNAETSGGSMRSCKMCTVSSISPQGSDNHKRKNSNFTVEMPWPDTKGSRSIMLVTEQIYAIQYQCDTPRTQQRCRVFLPKDII